MTATEPGARTMTAVVQEGHGTPDVLQIRDVAIPTITDNDILVHVHASSVNALDHGMVRSGGIVSLMTKLMRRPKPNAVRGVDVAGIVVALGKNVSTLKIGDEVFGVASGSWAEYAVGRERGLVPKPRNLTFPQAAAVGIAALTALQAVRDQAKPRPGQRTLVYGAGGGVGTYAVQLAKALGAHVTAVTSARNLDMVGTLRPDALIDYEAENIAKRDDRYDAVLDVAGSRPIGERLSLLALGGRLTIVGAPRGQSALPRLVIRLLSAVVRARVLGQPISIASASVKREDLVFLAGLLERGEILPAIDRAYPLTEVREAVCYAMSGPARAKVVLTLHTIFTCRPESVPH